MEEESNSWLRRTKYSHTIYHRFESLKLGSQPLTVGQDRIAGLKTRPKAGTSSRKASPEEKAVANCSEIQHDPVTNKRRSKSPTPEIVKSDAFKEAKTDRKRFSTPHPQRKQKEKYFHRESHEIKVSDATSSAKSSPARQLASNSSAARQLASMRSSKRKDSAWTKYFDHGGGKVTAVETSEEKTVDLSKLFLGLKFAHGAHSRLYHGIYKEEPVAVKIIRVPDDDETGCMAARLEKQFNREVTLLSRLQHKNIIKFIAAGRNPPVYCVITEYLSEGSLRAFLHKLEDKILPLEKLIPMALDVARGMEYIHSQGVIHRDLKPENILIDQDFCLRIADFGIACEEANSDYLADDPGTYRWSAPEMIKRKSFSRKVDVYSYGLLLWEMVAGAVPYEDLTPVQAAFAVVNKNLRPIVPADCPPAMRALIEQCWSSQPDKRPEFWQIVKVLEHFETSLAHDGTLDLVQSPVFHDHKKKVLHWIQKLGPVQPDTSATPKPKFS